MKFRGVLGSAKGQSLHGLLGCGTSKSENVLTEEVQIRHIVQQGCPLASNAILSPLSTLSEALNRFSQNTFVNKVIKNLRYTDYFA